MADSMRIGVKVVLDRLPALTKQMTQVLILGLDRGLSNIQRDSKAGAPVLSGALRASGFRISAVHDDFSTAVGRMTQLNPNAKPIEKPTIDGLEMYVGFAADYAIYVHEGAHGRAGRPFLLEAIERHKEDMVQGAKDDLERFIQSGSSGGPMNGPGGQGGSTDG